MMIYKVSQSIETIENYSGTDIHSTWDYYDSCIVIALNEFSAENIARSLGSNFCDGNFIIELVGSTSKMNEQILLASFNAG